VFGTLPLLSVHARASLAPYLRCEEHVKGLQQQHLAELGQRDYILQRCKDTILNLEVKVAGRWRAGGQRWGRGDPTIMHE
jgi:hypothetical protein